VRIKPALNVSQDKPAHIQHCLIFTLSSVGHFLIKVVNDDRLIGSLSKTTISQAISDLTHRLTLSEVIQQLHMRNLISFH
jgi:hypothetical protein